ncbi:MAG: hypothetical protein Q7R93_04410 [bacterium]|nr:hypothetical protein [bacterium]
MSNTSRLLLRIALAFSFGYVAYGFWLHPDSWTGYLPTFVTHLELSKSILIFLISGFHLVIALWILSGWKIFIPSVVAAVFLFSVVYFNRNQLDVLYRDISLALAALALAFSSRHS